MTRNLGPIDRAVRVLLGIGLLTFALAGEATAWWGWFGIVPLATGIVGYCPLYRLLHLSTARKAT
ncbi:MAG: hypothetical protein MNPFHGCM_00829 [Gemmatimonadaceae bacterium]|nr:hypothetical protein [Gemmatimonadaceae bacterium]